MADSKPIVFTEDERRELYTSVTSMYGKLLKDKHVDDKTKNFWWEMGEKLRKAKVWEADHD